jgi:hypothetical protein
MHNLCIHAWVCKPVMTVTYAVHATRLDNVLRAGSLNLNSCVCKSPSNIPSDRLRVQSKLEGVVGGTRTTNGWAASSFRSMSRASTTHGRELAYLVRP